MKKINAFDFLMKGAISDLPVPDLPVPDLPVPDLPVPDLPVPDFPAHKLMFDGGSRGNPGVCGCGYVVYHEDNVLLTGHNVVSRHNTSNFAEYMALILGLREVIGMGVRKLRVEGDSLLVIKQIGGEWSVKSPNLVPLYEEAKELCKHFTSIQFEHVKRGRNKTADALVNKALDEIDA